MVIHTRDLRCDMENCFLEKFSQVERNQIFAASFLLRLHGLADHVVSENDFIHGEFSIFFIQNLN